MAGLWKNIGKKFKSTSLKTGRFISSVMNHERPLAEDAVTLSIVAIVKNEADYIDEWIRYHLLVGVDRFYIYDNGSTDETRDILQKYVDEGIVVLREHPGRGQQLSVYNDALRRYKLQSKYIAFIDVDEFLYSCEPEKTVLQEIEELFTLYPNAGGLALNWRMFGSAGHVSKPEGGVLENYLYRSKEDGKGNKCIKTIVKPECVYKYVHAHYPLYYKPYYSVDENGNRVEGWSHPARKIRHLRINHYFTKSKEEWIVRRKLGRVGSKYYEVRSIEDFYAHDNNDIYDDGMLPFAEKLKNK